MRPNAKEKRPRYYVGIKLRDESIPAPSSASYITEGADIIVPATPATNGIDSIVAGTPTIAV
jgi:hypothetical protein